MRYGFPSIMRYTRSADSATRCESHRAANDAFQVPQRQGTTRSRLLLWIVIDKTPSSHQEVKRPDFTCGWITAHSGAADGSL